VVIIPVATSRATVSENSDLTQMGKLPSLGQTVSGWRDLNSRPLDPQIGPPRLSSVNHLSLVSMVDR
jgi:hypothetical protein